jgi:hypothetical protein
VREPPNDLLEREEQLAELADLTDALPSGTGATWLVQAGWGMGKTALAGRVCRPGADAAT